MAQTITSRIAQWCRLGQCKEALKHYLGGLYNRIEDDHVFLLSGGLAFSLFVSTIPLVLIVFAGLGIILQSPSLSEEISAFIDRLIPYPESASFVKEFVFTRVEEFKRFKNVAGIIGIFGLLFAASGLFSSLRTILNKVYRVRADYSVIIGKLLDFAFVVSILIYFLLSTTIVSIWEVTEGLADRFNFLGAFDLPYLQDLAIGVFSFLLIFVGYFVVYFSIPYKRPSKRVVFVSALAAAVMWEIAKQIFGFYISHFITLQRIYGAYVLLIIVAFWIYYTSIVFIIGAEIGQLYRERRARKIPMIQGSHPSFFRH